MPEFDLNIVAQAAVSPNKPVWILDVSMYLEVQQCM